MISSFGRRGKPHTGYDNGRTLALVIGGNVKEYGSDLTGQELMEYEASIREAIRENQMPEEKEILADYISGQAPDGWGKGFGQREIRAMKACCMSACGMPGTGPSRQNRNGSPPIPWAGFRIFAGRRCPVPAP